MKFAAWYLTSRRSRSPARAASRAAFGWKIRAYTIVRFNGVYTPVAGINGFNLHFDSWRLNVQPGLWLPAYVFSQESDLKDFMGSHVRFKSQTRLWGYNLKNVGRQEEFSELTIESPNAVQDQVAQSQDRSPIEAEREWQHQAETNVLDRLQRVGLLSPPGDVDKILETVVNNLEVTNNLDVATGSSLPRADDRHAGNVFDRPHDRFEPRSS